MSHIKSAPWAGSASRLELFRDDSTRPAGGSALKGEEGRPDTSNENDSARVLARRIQVVNPLSCFLKLALACSCCVGAASGQRAICGSGGYIPSQGSSIMVDPTLSSLLLHLPQMERTIDNSARIDKVDQACLLPNGRLLVFGNMSAPLVSNIEVIDIKDGTVIDSFWAFNNSLSPDGRWLMLRQFYPLHGVTASEVYRLYDLTKDAAENRVTSGESETPGKRVFPVVADAGTRPSGADEPESNLMHTFHSGGFYWSPDSKEVVFGDGVYPALSIVLVAISGGTAQAYVHPMSGADISGVTFVERPGTYEVVVEIGPPGSGNRPIDLMATDFSPAVREKAAAKPPRKPLVLDKKHQ